MTISSELIQAGPFNGDDVTTVHPFTMKVLHEGDLSVVRTDANGDKTTMVLTTDYTVSLNADQDVNPGGTIATTGGNSPLPTGETIDIFNEPPYTQLVDLVSNGAWNPQVVEGALDRLTILAKRARDRTGLDWRGEWSTGINYQIGNLVKHSGNVYYCLLDHVSGTFATDLAADNWVFWVEQGGIGPAGVTGGLLYNFDSNTATNTDPGFGDVRLNNATRSSVTEIAISNNTADSGFPDVGAYLASFDANSSSGVRGYIYIKKVADPSKLSVYSITGPSIDGTSFWRFAVTHVASVGTIADTDPVAIEFNSTFDVGVISQADAEAGTSTDNKIFTAEKVKQAIEALTPLPRGHIDGLLTSDGTVPTTDISISTGECRDSTNTVNLKLNSPIEKEIDSWWAAGGNIGGNFASATPSINTQYYLFLIKKDSDGSIDAGFDDNENCTNIPSGYTYFRRISTRATDGTGLIIPLVHTAGGRHDLITPVLDVDITNLGTTAQSNTLSVPPIDGIEAILNLGTSSSSGTNLEILVSSLDIDDQSPTGNDASATIGNDRTDTTTKPNYLGGFRVKTNSSGQIRLRAGNSNTPIAISLTGWIDQLGKDS